jgi:putative DNA-invertase from lambdoid prophage Rac
MAVLAAVAQFERDLLIERTHAGLARAKAEGKKLGRRDALTDAQKTEIRAKLVQGATARGLAREYGVTHPTISRLGIENEGATHGATGGRAAWPRMKT